MGNSSMIYVVIVGLWVAYLVPKLARRDVMDGGEGAESLGEDGVLHEEREPRVVRPAATPAAPPARDHARAAPPSGRDHARSAPPSGRDHAREAARRRTARRRRVLVVLAALPVLSAVAAVLGRLDWAAALVPLALPALYLGQLRRVTAATRTRRPTRPAATRRAAEPAKPQAPAAAPADPLPAAAPREEPAASEAAAPAGPGAPVAPAGHGAVAATPEDPAGPRSGEWEPVPLTLPTYVTKPKAVRTGRSIDLSGAGGSWTQVDGFVVCHAGVTTAIDLGRETAPAQAPGAGAPEASGARQRAAGE